MHGRLKTFQRRKTIDFAYIIRKAYYTCQMSAKKYIFRVKFIAWVGQYLSTQHTIVGVEHTSSEMSRMVWFFFAVISFCRKKNETLTSSTYPNCFSLYYTYNTYDGMIILALDTKFYRPIYKLVAHFDVQTTCLHIRTTDISFEYFLGRPYSNQCWRSDYYVCSWK